MSYRPVSLKDILLEKLIELGHETSMGFNGYADAVHWCMRQGIDKLRALKVNQHYKTEQEAAEVEA